MKMFSNLLLSFLVSINWVSAQCTDWQEVSFDSFEYTTVCPFILAGTTYQTSPQPSPTFGPNYSGSYHIYLNFQNGYVGPAFSRPYTVCVGQSYQISFFHRDAWGGQNNTTFNIYDANGVLLSSDIVPWTGTTWNNYVSPTLVATTTTLLLEIVNNSAALGNNDMVVDDMRLEVCGYSEQSDFFMCTQGGTMDLFTLFSANMPTGGTWTGPSALSNGALGTYDPSVNTSGTYTYTLPSQAPCATPFGTVLVSNVSNLELGPDTVLCPGQTVVLDAGSGYDFYSWSTGATTQTITASTAGTYTVNVGATGSNLVVNGDFESGNTGFSTDYSLGTGGSWGLLSLEGTYAISTSPSLAHTNFSPCTDVTTGTGNMMVVNGSGLPNSDVWCQTITVDPNTDYLFSAWATNALNELNVANLQFFVNGVQIGPVFSTTTAGCDWIEFNDVWSSGASTTANICIVNQNTTVGGNDFAIDDIFFAPICSLTDELTVTIDPITVDAGSDLTFCADEPELIVASTNDPNASVSWSSGQSTLSFEPTVSGTYTITVTSQNGCTAQDNVLVDIATIDWSIQEILTQPADCGINNGVVSALMDGVFNDPPSYQWSGPGAGSSNFYNASTWTNLSPGWYFFSVESDGCYRYDSVEVVVNDPPIAMGSVSPSYGEVPLSVVFDNSSVNATNYFWDFGNGTTASVNNLDPISVNYDSVGVYTIMLVAYDGPCSDTLYLSVTVVEPPVLLPYSIEVPNVFTPNGDNVNDFFQLNLVNVASLEIVILNRWGNILAEGNDINFSWDGRVGGELATEGTYFYRYTAVPLQGEEVKGHGFFELAR